jgi:hypothetical protein
VDQRYGLHTDSQLQAGGAKEYQLRGGLERHVSMLLYLTPSAGGGSRGRVRHFKSANLH